MDKKKLLQKKGKKCIPSTSKKKNQTKKLAAKSQLRGKLKAKPFAKRPIVKGQSKFGSIPATASTVIRECCRNLVISDENINIVASRFLAQIKMGLAKATNAAANIKCFPTYVQDLPKGDERGKFLALDLGGTNFRVLMINLTGDINFEMESRIFDLPLNLLSGSSNELFDFIAEALFNFVKELNLIDEMLPLAFTFSFPIMQKGLAAGILQRWTKGYSTSGVVGKDVVQLLKQAIDRRGDIKVDIVAILNDTTGTLMSCAWRNRDCKIGLIVGTGCNGCYVEKVSNVELFEGYKDPNKPNVIINCEFGAFAENGDLDFVRTEYDREVDEHSPNKGNQIFEKMISGMYMGEIARLATAKFYKAGLIFKGLKSDVLLTRGKFPTRYVSQIEDDDRGVYKNCRMILKELRLDKATVQDCANLRYICECCSRRAAFLVSAAIASLINKINEPWVSVGVDGTVYRLHPKFHCLMTSKITKLLNPGLKFNLMLSEDGSGRGAALIAAIGASAIKN